MRTVVTLVSVIALAAGCPLGGCTGRAAQKESDQMSHAQPSRSPSTRPESAGSTVQAMFAAGCFWGVEATFRQVEGVVSTAVGYSGGHLDHPTYEDVCGDATGHAEVVWVEYDPTRVSYDKLLEVFWECHDPTTPNRQGPDVGSQYRSAIFYFTPQQEAQAKSSKELLGRSGRLSRPIVTEITAASAFWRAEEYHQQYVARHGGAACASTIRK